MNLFNRLVMILIAAILVVVGGFLVAGTSEWLPPEMFARAPLLARLVRSLHDLPGMTTFYTALGGMVGFAGGAVLLWLELRSPRFSRQILLGRDRLGIVTVSVNGLRRLAVHALRDIEGVDQVTSQARIGRNGIQFRCRIVVDPDASSTELAAEVRQRLIEAVKRHTGKQVAGIDVQTQIGVPEVVQKALR